MELTLIKKKIKRKKETKKKKNFNNIIYIFIIYKLRGRTS